MRSEFLSEWLLFAAVSSGVLESMAHYGDSERTGHSQHLLGGGPPPATGEEGFLEFS